MQHYVMQDFVLQCLPFSPANTLEIIATEKKQ